MKNDSCWSKKKALRGKAGFWKGASVLLNSAPKYEGFLTRVQKENRPGSASRSSLGGQGKEREW